MEDFRMYSKVMQRFHYETFGGTLSDVIKPCESMHFRKILSNYMDGNAASALAEKMDFSKNLYFRILIVNGYTKTERFMVPVVKVWASSGKQVFYDHVQREYKSWEDYLSNNTLPKCTMVFPAGGIYKKLSNSNDVDLEVRDSPAKGVLKLIDSGLYILATIGDFVCSAAPLFGFMKPYAVAVDSVSGICNGYRIGRNAVSLYDRKVHGQSISLSDEEAGKHWSHIGNGFISCALTVTAMHMGKPSNEMFFYNLITAVQKSMMSDDPLRSLSVLKSQFLSMHLFVISDVAAEYLQRFLKCNLEMNLGDIIYKLKNFVSNTSGKGQNSKFRSLFHIDDSVLRNALNTVMCSKQIQRFPQTNLYDLFSENHKFSEAILGEIKKWDNGNISTAQLKFRICYICHGKKPYETINEMCEHFKVTRKEDIVVNGTKVFEGVDKYLTNFIETTVKQYPQLLVNFVEYVQEGNEKSELDGFRKYFMKRIATDIEEDFRRINVPNTVWVNALTFQKLDYTRSVPSNEINFVRPMEINGAPIGADDIFRLAKKLLGRVGEVDVKFVRPGVNRVVAVSAVSKLAVIVGERITEDFGSVCGCHPVFKYHF